jgi:hypothetical protein
VVLADGHLVPGSSTSIPLDGVPPPAQIPGDLPNSDGLGEQVIWQEAGPVLRSATWADLR